jgi:hypothetical protein
MEEKSIILNQDKYLKYLKGILWEIERLYDRSDITFLNKNKNNIKGVE